MRDDWTPAEVVGMRIGQRHNEEPWALEIKPTKDMTSAVQVANDAFLVGPDVDLDQLCAFVNAQREGGRTLAAGTTTPVPA